MNKKLEYLIVKFINNDLNNEETALLKELLNNDENKTYFKEYVELNYLINLKADFNDDESLQQFKSKINRNKNYNYKKVFKYAAIFLLFVSVGAYFYINTNINNVKEPVIVNNNVTIGTNKAVLTLEDGTVVSLEKGSQYIGNNVVSNGKEITYKASEKGTSEVVYNYLTIPRGGEYHLKLSDGTHVWLNSESKLKYPKSFIDGQSREVELVYGEAYFDVSPSVEHSGSRFNVITKMQKVEVLGTEFNIKAYPETSNIYTTLVEGSIALKSEKNEKILTPNQQSIIDANKPNEITIIPVDTYAETVWKEGVFVFKGKSLKEIMLTLSRWYDVDIVFEDKSLETKTFRGVLRKHQKLEEILSVINLTSISGYEINNKTVIIK